MRLEGQQGQDMRRIFRMHSFLGVFNQGLYQTSRLVVLTGVLAKSNKSAHFLFFKNNLFWIKSLDLPQRSFKALIQVYTFTLIDGNCAALKGSGLSGWTQLAPLEAVELSGLRFVLHTTISVPSLWHLIQMELVFLLFHFSHLFGKDVLSREGTGLYCHEKSHGCRKKVVRRLGQSKTAEQVGLTCRSWGPSTPALNTGSQVTAISQPCMREQSERATFNSSLISSGPTTGPLELVSGQPSFR